MPDPFQVQYRDEFIYGFEDRQTILRSTAIQETVIKGNQAIFLVSDSGGATAVTRGMNGLIPARTDNNEQLTCTLTEWHDLVRKTDFNVFVSQGNQKRLMQETSMAVINRKIEDIMLAELETATATTGTAAEATIDMLVYARTILGNNFVDIADEDNMFCLISPAFDGYLMQTPEYASADYVDVKPFTGPARKFRRYMGLNFMVHPRLTGSVGRGGDGTSESCFMYHRKAIGCAVWKEGLQTPVGYDEEQAYSWARVSIAMGAKLLQQEGIVQMNHNAAGYVAGS